jgi:hypothetical protein
MNLFEVSRCRCQAGDQRLENLFDILGSLDDHHQHHDIVVHGLAPTELQTAPDEQGFRIVETTPDGFVAAQIPEVRDRFIGRF